MDLCRKKEDEVRRVCSIAYTFFIDQQPGLVGMAAFAKLGCSLSAHQI